jgi:hypothetical protein
VLISSQASLEKMREKNKMLVSILSQSETKEKAQILFNMEKMKAVRRNKLCFKSVCLRQRKQNVKKCILCAKI